MDYTELTAQVHELFKSLEADIAEIQAETGLHCIENCVKCCTFPKIEATVLEFIPLALHLYNQGKAQEALDKLEQNPENPICIFLNTTVSGNMRAGCTQYHNRGLVCRLFGYSHVTDKHNLRKLATCKPIKEQQAESVEKAVRLLEQKNIGPKGSHYYTQLHGLDFNLGGEFYPINHAIKLALEKVVTYYYYQNL